jgi:GT2 family glycosyltransferase
MKPMRQGPVSIVIPNYNGRDILPQTLDGALAALAAYSGRGELIVVDDASTDDSVGMLRDRYPTIKVVRHETNRGFAEAVHTGVNVSQYAIVILLNSDVHSDTNFIAPLVRWFEQADTFSVSPLIMDRDHRPQRVSWNRLKIIRGEIRKTSWDLQQATAACSRGQPLKSLFASGGSVALRKDMFLELGGFLPIFKPFYGEDRDLGTRAWRRGWLTFFEPQSLVVHDHVGTIKRFFPKQHVKVIRKRNRFLYQWIHLSGRTLAFSHIPWIFFRLPLRLLRLDLVYAQGLFQALRRIGAVVAVRQQLSREDCGGSLQEVIEAIERPS